VELAVFVCAAAMVLVGAAGVITRSNPVHAALSLVLTLFGVAVMFVAQGAYFVAAVQVIVYAGAIVVLFLFVIMLLGVDRAEDVRTEPLTAQRPLALVVALGAAAVLVAAVVDGAAAVRDRAGSAPDAASGDADVVEIARSVFGDYVVAFEVTSILLVVAVVGTVLMTRRRLGTGAGR
jgi:NADH-quinone oxidoreductase subunit J